MYGIPEGVPLRKVEVTYDNEARAFFLTPRGVAVAADSDLLRWLQLDRSRIPLRKHIRICLEKQLLGEVQCVWQLAGEGLRKPVENFALSAEQLQLVLHFSARQVDQALLLAVLRGYDQAEGRPPRKQVQRPIPQSRKPAPPVVIPEQTKAAPIRLGDHDYPPDDPMGFRANFDPEYKATLNAEETATPESAQAEVIAEGIELVPFVGGTLSVMRQNDRGWLVVKPACEALGIDAEAQRKRLVKSPWATASVIEAVGADGKQREMFCLRSDRVAMWLATIDTTRITDPAARQRLEVWQCEAAEALDKWWRGKQAPVGESPKVVTLSEDDVARIVRKILKPEEQPPTPTPQPTAQTDTKEPSAVEWLSPADAAKLLNVGVKRVYQWLKDNSLGHYRFGPREVRISSAQLQAFVDAQLRATQH